MSVMGKIIPQISSRNFGRLSAALYSGKYNRNYFTYTQELSQPLDRKPEYVTAKEAFEKCLKSGKFLILLAVPTTCFYAVLIMVGKDLINLCTGSTITYSGEDLLGQQSVCSPKFVLI